jgi:chromosome segregation ATPase
MSKNRNTNNKNISFDKKSPKTNVDNQDKPSTNTSTSEETSEITEETPETSEIILTNVNGDEGWGVFETDETTIVENIKTDTFDLIDEVVDAPGKTVDEKIGNIKDEITEPKHCDTHVVDTVNKQNSSFVNILLSGALLTSFFGMSYFYSEYKVNALNAAHYKKEISNSLDLNQPLKKIILDNMEIKKIILDQKQINSKFDITSEAIENLNNNIGNINSIALKVNETISLAILNADKITNASLLNKKQVLKDTNKYRDTILKNLESQKTLILQKKIVLENEIDTLVETKQNISFEKNELDKLIKSSNKTLNITKTTILENNNKIRVLKKDIEQTKLIKNKLLKDVKRNKDLISRSTKILGFAADKISGLKLTIDKNKQSVTNIKNKTTILASNIISRVETLKKQLLELNKQVDYKTTILSKTENDIKNANFEFDKLKNKKDIISTLKHENKSLQNKIDKLQNQLNSKNNSNGSLW